MTAVRITQLYPDELGVAGDRGNVLALTARLAASGFQPEVIEYRRGGALPSTTDLVLIGGGPLSAVRNIYTDLLVAGPRLREWADTGTTFFAYGAGAELLGHSIELLPEGDGIGGSLEGLGIFPFRARRVRERTVGYVIVDAEVGRLVGFEDNASVWTLNAGARPLGAVVAGDGNGDGSEGVVAGTSIATQIGGPVLPLNPSLTDGLIASVARAAGVEPTPAAPSPLDDYARRAREVMAANASHVFSRI